MVYHSKPLIRRYMYMYMYIVQLPWLNALIKQRFTVVLVYTIHVHVHAVITCIMTLYCWIYH